MPLDLVLEWAMVENAASALGCFVGGYKSGKIKTLLCFDSYDRPRYGLKEDLCRVTGTMPRFLVLPASSGSG